MTILKKKIDQFLFSNLPLEIDSKLELPSTEFASCESPFSPLIGGVASDGLFGAVTSCSPSGKRRLRLRSKNWN